MSRILSVNGRLYIGQLPYLAVDGEWSRSAYSEGTNWHLSYPSDALIHERMNDEYDDPRRHVLRLLREHAATDEKEAAVGGSAVAGSAPNGELVEKLFAGEKVPVQELCEGEWKDEECLVEM